MKKLIILGTLLSVTLTGCSNTDNVGVELANEEPITAPVVSIYEVAEYIEPVEPLVVEEAVEEAVEETVVIPEPTTTTYRVTAYCACAKCCGKWALNRPIDEFGNEIVKGAAGVELVDGYTVASPLPFGTKVDLEGYGVVEVQDRTAKWIVEEYGENVIDIYINDHDKAWDFGVKYWEGTIQ